MYTRTMFCAIICSDISLLGALRQEQEKSANRSVTRWGSTWPTPFHSSDTSTFYGVFLGEVVLRCMASDCLGRAGLAELTTSRRGSASLYLVLSATLIIVLSFFIVIYSISSSGEPQEGGAQESAGTAASQDER